MTNFTFSNLPLEIKVQVKKILCTRHSVWIDLIGEGDYQIRYCAERRNGAYLETLEVKAHEVMSYNEWRKRYKGVFGYLPCGIDKQYYGVY